MWRWLTIALGCIFILQGCVSDSKGVQKNQEEVLEIDLNQQLIQAAERQ
jgi:hypothetical protein